MFSNKNVEPNKLQIAIDDLFAEMKTVNGDSEEYEAMVKRMDVLYRLQEVDNNVKKTGRVDPNTVVMAGANILGILMIVGYERMNVVTSKAMSLLSKTV